MWDDPTKSDLVADMQAWVLRVTEDRLRARGALIEGLLAEALCLQDWNRVGLLHVVDDGSGNPGVASMLIPPLGWEPYGWRDRPRAMSVVDKYGG